MPTLEEQIKAQTERAQALVAQTEAEGEKTFAGSSFEQALSPETKAITSADLIPATPLPFVPLPTEPDNDITDIPQATFPDELTPAEKTQTDLEKRLQQINESLIDRSTFETQKQEEFGVGTARQAVDDLNAQLADLQRQQKLIPAALDIESEGRGRTAGGTAPLEIGRRRALAFDALTTASLLDSAQLRLTSAQRKVDQAVSARYNPLIAEKNAIIENLGIIENSSETSRQDRERARARAKVEQEQKDKLETAKTEARGILAWANKATAELAQAGKLSPQFNARINEITQLIESGGTEADAAQLYSDIVNKAGIVSEDLETPDLQFISGTANQPSGVFNKATGVFTPSVSGGGTDMPIGVSPITGKPFTEIQSKSALFATRIENAEKTLSLGKNFRDIAPAQFLKSDERRQFEQASKNFVTAVLRKESGAAIAESEFEDAAKIYIPQFGDDETTLEQKAEARKIAFQEMVNASVGGYEQLTNTFGAGISTPTTGVTSSGIKYTIE